MKKINFIPCHELSCKSFVFENNPVVQGWVSLKRNPTSPISHLPNPVGFYFIQPTLLSGSELQPEPMNLFGNNAL